MRITALLLGAIFAAVSISSASALVRIKADPGGQIGPYLENLMELRNSGERVAIDGPCLSACTMVLGVIPRERICVTSRARLGFHAAWNPDQRGQPVTSQRATKFLMDIYPEHVRDVDQGPRRVDAALDDPQRSRTRRDVSDLPASQRRTQQVRARPSAPSAPSRADAADQGRDRHGPIGLNAVAGVEHARQPHRGRHDETLRDRQIALRGGGDLGRRDPRHEAERAEMRRTEREPVQALQERQQQQPAD